MRIYKRDASPHHFKLEIKSYSSLSTTLAEKYESNAFEAGGHKWRLSLYPNQMINGHCYISLYLATAKSSFPSLNSLFRSISARRSLMSEYNGISDEVDVYATFRLFVFDQKQQKYFTVEDGAGILRRFNEVTREVGFAKFLPRDTFEHPSEGYLLNDCCTFGAELCVYPKGYGQHKDVSLSLYLRSADDLYTLPSVYVEFKLRVVDRAYNLHHIERTGKHWFVSSDNTFGWLDFMPLRILNDPSKGFLRDDILSVVIEMPVMHGS
ncbi:hypothetical protein L3X38_012753 [Prunus dulcis]|uniref:MATH domain-containing protein n=1 Tax=Prunus dulcis TaxID=3755 RepID=A0AAD4WKN3_PRUDU|nr:hypothetical protein L3X38_012753 [Prunus dulcis]